MKTLARPECRAELIARLATIRADSAAKWGRMSAPQMICHTSDAFRMALGGKAVSSFGGLTQRTFVKWLALYAPLRWPPNIKTRPEIDQQLTGTCPGDFAADVAELRGFIDTMAGVPRDFAWPAHPIFGVLSWRAWMRWGYLHTDHHLRQFGA